MTNLTANLPATSLTAAQNRASFTPVRDRLSRNNRKDTFFFTLSGRSSFNAVLKDIKPSANVDLILLDGSGQKIGKSTRKGNQQETIQISSLEAGTYTLRAVLKSKKGTKYTLSSSASLFSGDPGASPGLTDTAGNTLATARPISLGATPSSFSDRVSATDTDDFYSFTVGDAANPSVKLNLLLTRTPGLNSADISLRDSLGNEVGSTYVGSSDGSGTLTETVAAGTYYVQVKSSSTEPFVYNLALSATPIPDTAGSTPTAARTLALSPTPTTLNEFVGTGDTKDFYAFTVGAPGSPSGRLSASLTGINGNLLGGSATVRLRDSLNNVIQSEYPSGGGGSLFDTKLAAGTYYLEIETSSPNVDYSLNLTSTPIADAAGNTPGTARSISVGSTTSSFTDFVGPGDGDDYYRFTVPGGTFNLTFTGVGGNLLTSGATVSLLDSLSSSIDSGYASGGGGTSLNRSLMAGTYYVRVETSSSVGTDYTLNLSLT